MSQLRHLVWLFFTAAALLSGSCGDGQITGGPGDLSRDASGDVVGQSPVPGDDGPPASDQPDDGLGLPAAPFDDGLPPPPPVNEGPPEVVVPGSSACSDGIDNDGDGLVDWQHDLGCYNAADATEGGLATRSIDNGWSVFEPANDTRIIYVSSSDGSDGNEGLSPARAKKTIAAGLALARDGYPDWVLLKRGDTWTGDNDLTLKNGRSKTEPFLLGTYGSSTARPEVRTGSGGAFKNLTWKNGSVVGIYFYADGRDPRGGTPSGGWNTNGRGINLQGSGNTNLLVEDCWFNFYASNSIKNASGISVRRSIFTNNYDSTAHGQGLYMSGNVNVLFEGNYLDHNGWYKKQIGGGNEAAEGQANVFNHNTYFSSMDNVTVRENIYWRPSSICMKFATNGSFVSNNVLIEDNLLVDCEVGMSIGGNVEGTGRYVDYTVRDNVFTNMGETLPTSRSLAWYFTIEDWSGGFVQDNLFLFQTNPGNGNSFGIEITETINVDGVGNSGITIEDNLFYELYNGKGLIRSRGNYPSMIVRNNDFQLLGQAQYLITSTSPVTNFSFSGNNYYSKASINAWFDPDSTDRSTSWWASQSNTTGETFNPTTFPDPRGIEEYQASVGQAATIAAFMAAAQSQSKYTWDEDYEAGVVNDWIRGGFAK